MLVELFGYFQNLKCIYLPLISNMTDAFGWMQYHATMVLCDQVVPKCGMAHNKNMKLEFM